MAMFSRKPLPESTLETLLFVADGIAQAIDRKRAEEALRTSEAYLAEAQRLSHIVSWGGNLITKQVFHSSDEHVRLYGFDPTDGVPSFQDFYSRIHPQDEPRVTATLQTAIHVGADFDFEFRLLLPDGTVKYLRTIGHPNPSGEPGEYSGISIEVTERKRAEETLRRSEAYLVEGQRLTHTGSWATRSGMDKAFYWSEEMFRIWGFDPQQGPPEHAAAWQRIYPQDLNAFVQEQLEKVSSGNLKTDIVLDHRIVLPDGTLKYIHSTTHPVVSESGNVVEYIGTCVVVTERKRAEQELRKSEQRLRAIFDNEPECVKVLDAEGFLLEMNSAGLRMIEADSVEQVRNRFLYPFVCEEHRAAFRQLHERVLRGESGTVEFQIVGLKGGRRWLETHASPLRDDRGTPVAALGITRDITERKRAEAERERLRQLETELARMNRVSMMGELAGSLGHEIKQPIAAAVSNAEACLQWLAREQPDLVEVREAATEMVKEARRAAEIMTRTRALFRVFVSTDNV
jgi:PAS domain S-box-containing protein